MIRFEHLNGGGVFVRPRAVIAIFPSLLDEGHSQIFYSMDNAITVKGTPDDVHSRLYPDERTPTGASSTP